MATGWRYRIQSIIGVAALSAIAVAVANSSIAYSVIQRFPIVGLLATDAPVGAEFIFEVLITTAVITSAFAPLYKPRPRRISNIIMIAQKQVMIAGFALATIGYFDYTYRIPRVTLITVMPLLAAVLPAWFVWIRRRPDHNGERVILVGDDIARVENIINRYSGQVLGYVAPPRPYSADNNPSGREPIGIADGGQTVLKHGYIGGLSRFEDVIEEYDVDSAILAFELADRTEFFGALQVCHEHGIDAKAHIDHMDNLLISSEGQESPLVDINIDPLDIQDRLFKRVFDFAFAGIGLLVLSPVILLIATAIKIEGNGPILFSQERTFRFGDTFDIYKFRTLKPEPDGEVGTTFEEERQTPLGNLLRTTHLDEIPQLWSIFIGNMSVVGPRPAQTELEPDFEEKATNWRRRWFIKPGLTGLAQIRGATSKEPALKMDYDIEYIRRQSLRFDLKIVLQQFWQVVSDVITLGQKSEKG